MIANKLPRIAFLFGAGISIPAKMPKTVEITERVLSCNNIERASDGSYYLNRYSEKTEQYLKRIRVMVDFLKEEVSRFYSVRQADGGPSFNYEDLYYMARQIEDYAEGAQDNPVILPFIEKISPHIEPLFNASDDDVEEWTLWSISRETLRYIEGVVRGMLRKKPESLNYLSFIGEACEACKAVDIFTLNQDTVLEQYLKTEGIPFSDGFGAENGGVRRWDPSLLQSGEKGIRLFKLHGAVNWYLYRPEGGMVLDDILCINDGYAGDAEGMTRMVGERPEILIGTYNKMVDYANGAFLDLRHMFCRSMHSTGNVVVSGYSFGDHGINKMLDSWIKLPGRRLMVIDPDAETFKSRKSRWVESRVPECWDELKSRGILKCIPQMIEDVSREEIAIWN